MASLLHVAKHQRRLLKREGLLPSVFLNMERLGDVNTSKVGFSPFALILVSQVFAAGRDLSRPSLGTSASASALLSWELVPDPCEVPPGRSRASQVERWTRPAPSQTKPSDSLSSRENIAPLPHPIFLQNK